MEGARGIQACDSHVLERIFAHLRLPEDRHGWVPATCALVCRDWRDVYLASVVPSQAVKLCTLIQLGGGGGSGGDAAALRSAAVSCLRYARGATSAELDVAVLRKHSLEARATVKALQLCLDAAGPALAELRLAVPPGLGSMLHTLCPCPGLLRLSLDYRRHSPLFGLPWITDSILHLQAFTLLGGQFGMPLDTALLHNLSATSLTSLVLDGTRFNGGLRACRQLSRLSELRHLALRGMAEPGDFSVHTCLPEQVSALTALTHLDFSRNGFLGRLPPLAHLSLLEHLDLSFTLLGPTAGAVLDLRGVSGLTHLALTGFVAGRVDLLAHPRLCSLALPMCHLFEPPPSLEFLSCLTCLDLSRGMNGKLATPLAARLPPQLRALDAAASGLRMPPLGLAAVLALTALDLSGNRMTAGLEHLAGLAHSLQSLSLAACGLEALPRALGALSQLTVLTLADNKGLQLKNAADVLGGLPRLQALVLAETGLRAVPPALCTLRSITHLDLSGNEGLRDLAALAPLGSTLRSLDLSRCVLCELPPALPALTRLSLRDSLPWGHLQGSLAGCGRLLELDVSGCALGALPAGVKGLVQLVRMGVGPGGRLAAPQEFGSRDASWLETAFGVGGPFVTDVTLHRAWV